jgi:hypothetical protein|tara:strand:+ start:897 stop:1082 length:186 start_codon:yes stop_codon:yes gene_type:complete
MLSIGVLFFAIGFILIIFNSIDFSFVRDQKKDKSQLIAGIAFVVVSVFLLFISIKNLMQLE